ncbi:hypothetical protein B0H16DRAFT_1723507 [Mycena metata]|uniref:Short-chain dehydrogenase n=1 Tax=Mycena metata TaxID=1033252 RepID=A0AAD7N9M4_9AGAR|nr:hypothetical protein B0H16DRAFT_1723507 [Mycena metata]
MSDKFTFHTTAEEVATAFAGEIKDKNVLITGTSLNGLGFETARVIARYANLVVITGHDEDRLKLAENALKEAVPTATIRRLILNLASLSAVRKAAAEVNAYPEPIHVLINNAAAPMAAFKLTVDGLENQITVAHVGPLLFNHLVAPKLLSSANTTTGYTPRVVIVASNAHQYCRGLDFDTVFSADATKYEGTEAYGVAKSANLVAMLEMAKRARGRLGVYAVHPGVINTGLYRDLKAHPELVPKLKAMGLLDENGEPSSARVKWKTIEEGAASTVAAAFDPALNDKSGTYLTDASKDITSTIAAHASDPARTERLWELTEEVVGERFTFSRL